MGKAKKAGKYKPFRMLRIPEPLAASLEAFAEKRYSTMTEQAKQAIREYLERRLAPGVRHALQRPDRPQAGGRRTVTPVDVIGDGGGEGGEGHS